MLANFMHSRRTKKDWRRPCMQKNSPDKIKVNEILYGVYIPGNTLPPFVVPINKFTRLRGSDKFVTWFRGLSLASLVISAEQVRADATPKIRGRKTLCIEGILLISSSYSSEVDFYCLSAYDHVVDTTVCWVWFSALLLNSVMYFYEYPSSITLIVPGPRQAARVYP